jgi:hypothetical protein
MVVFKDNRNIDTEVPQELAAELDKRLVEEKQKENVKAAYRLEKPVTEMGYDIGGDEREKFTEVLEEHFFVGYPGGKQQATSFIVSRFKNLAEIMTEEQMWPARGDEPRHDLQGILFWPAETREGCHDLLLDIAQFTENREAGQFK